MRRCAAIGAVLLVIAVLYAWYVRSGDAWYTGAYASGHLLRIAIRDDNPPFSFLDGAGELAGFDADISRALCERLKVKCELLPQDQAGDLISALIDGKYDAVISSLPITSLPLASIQPWALSFTNKYYSFPARISCCGPDAGSYVAAGGQPNGVWRFVAKKGAAIEISPSGLDGKRVGIENRSGYDTYMRSEFPGAVRVIYKSQAAADLEMASGKLDLLLADSRIVSESFLNTDLGRDYEFVGPAITDPKLLGSDAGIAVRSEDTELREALNQALAALRADGTYAKINDKYFDFNIYGQ